MPRGPRPPFLSFVLLLWLLLWTPLTKATFPQDPHPLLTSDLQGISPLSWFRGLEDDAVARELGLDFQRFLILNRTLLVAARDHVFSFDLQAEDWEGLIPNKYLTWRSQDVENCAVRGKLRDECYNYIRVLVPRDSRTLLACGTNSFSPMCRSYEISSLQQEGEELSGQARCPFDATQSSVAIFAEPHFVHAVEHRDHVYFFFREVSVEDARLGRVQFSRVARVCKRDVGGSPRALDRHWTSFLKLRLNCSVPGDSAFYFDVLQALTGPIPLHGRPALFGVFTTQTNSIPGSAVCAFYLDDIERGFEGKFKEQRSPDGAWAPVPEDRVPSPRPGSCAGVGRAASFPSSRDLPDEVLTFIKAHPLLDPAVPPATHRPLLTRTGRALLTQVAVDGAAGRNGNTTVLFLGTEIGTVLKVLPPGSGYGNAEPVLLEEIDTYSSSRCGGKRSAELARQVLGLVVDPEGHRLFVAFSGCVVHMPLSRCTRHGACQKSCLDSQDPYCGWGSFQGCVDVRGYAWADLEQDGDREVMEEGDCHDGATGSHSGPGDSAYEPLGPSPPPEAPSPPNDAHPWAPPSTLRAHIEGVRRDPSHASSPHTVPVPLLLASVAAAFALGASISGFLVSCACRHAYRHGHRGNKDIETPGLPRPLSLRSLARLHGGGPDPPAPAKEGDSPPVPQLYTTFLPPTEGMPAPELACLPTPESTPELPVKQLQPVQGPWEWNHNGNNAKESSAHFRSGSAPAPRVLVRPPPPGCPGQAVEVTTLEELLRYLHAPQPSRKGTEVLSPANPGPSLPFATRAQPCVPPLEPAHPLFSGSSPLPRDCTPPLRLDIPPDGKCQPPSRPPLSAPAPRLGVGGTRGISPSPHRVPPGLLTRVPSGGASRYSGGHGRYPLYLGRPEGYRGRALKRVDVEKPQLPPKAPVLVSSPSQAAPPGGHFNY
ncbi:semaphorin-6C isoform X4 [Gracilinanus agilis]|uniref:semaphorin-6C isoform X4 n=1 Tax=Gracilinanus agilis TaxID=191870 RepID=UPI001CFC866D|nr:semaphorin-6C isoform X4 [Gracilinanus agilis]